MRITAQRLCDWTPVLLVTLVLAVLVLGPLAAMASDRPTIPFQPVESGRWNATTPFPARTC